MGQQELQSTNQTVNLAFKKYAAALLFMTVPAILLIKTSPNHSHSDSPSSQSKILHTLENLPGERSTDHYAPLLQQPSDWFASGDARRIAANIHSFQSEPGGWPKNIDITKAPFTGNPRNLEPSFDNGATVNELRFLARVYQATRDKAYRQAFEKGMDYVLKAQYPTGGWPQQYPPPANYRRHVTFNDNTMVHVMEFLREANLSNSYSFLDNTRRRAAQQAFDHGISYVLKSQIKVHGKLSAWCAQHDEKDYSPRPARAYELISLSGYESVAIVRLLMSVDNPSPDVVQAIEGAMDWFDSAKLKGIRLAVKQETGSTTGQDRVIVKDPTAPPLWARFYEIGTNRPIFVDRDGIVRYNLSEIGHERRNNYNWLGNWPQQLIEKEYPAWKLKQKPNRKN